MKNFCSITFAALIICILLSGNARPAYALGGDVCYVPQLEPALAAHGAALTGALAVLGDLITRTDNANNSVQIGNSLTDAQSAVTDAEITDKKTEANVQDERVLRGTERMEDAMFDNRDVNLASDADCINETTSIASDAKLLSYSKEVRKVTDGGFAMLKTGAPGGGPAYMAQLDAARLKDLQEGGDKAAKHSANARVDCSNDACYRDAQLKQLEIIIGRAAAPKPLSNKVPRTPEILDYERALKDWQDLYVKALYDIQNGLPHMLADVDNFAAAERFVQDTSSVTNPADKIKGKFPKGDITGISYYEMLEFKKEFVEKELGIRGNNVTREQYIRTRELRQQIQDQIKEANDEQAAYDAAIAFLKTTKPPKLSSDAQQVVQ